MSSKGEEDGRKIIKKLVFRKKTHLYIGKKTDLFSITDPIGAYRSPKHFQKTKTRIYGFQKIDVFEFCIKKKRAPKVGIVYYCVTPGVPRGWSGRGSTYYLLCTPPALP